jgi:tetratricopeptide (TPR) repeat protein
LAGIAHQRGQYEEAAAEAEKALELDPADARAMQIRYDAYRLAGDKEKAAEAAQALAQTGALADTARRIFNEAAALYNSGDMAGAKAKFLEAVQLDPNLIQAYSVLAGIYLRENNMAEAGAMATELLERDPENVNALKIKYDTARHLGDSEGAKEALKGLATADPEWVATGLHEVAVELFNGGQQAEAAAAFEEVIEVRPDHPEAHYMLGLCYFNTGDVPAAKEHLTKFLELAPEHQDAPVAREMLKYAN